MGPQAQRLTTTLTSSPFNGLRANTHRSLNNPTPARVHGVSPGVQPPSLAHVEVRAWACGPCCAVPLSPSPSPSPCPRPRPRPHAPSSPRPGALPFLTQHGTVRRDPQPPALGPAWRLWEPRPCPGRHTWEPRREALPRLGGFPGPPQALAPAQPGARSRASPSRLPCEAFGALCFENILKTLGSPNNMSKTFLFSAEKVERLFLSRKCGPGSPPALSRGRQRGRWGGQGPLHASLPGPSVPGTLGATGPPDSLLGVAFPQNTWLLCPVLAHSTPEPVVAGLPCARMPQSLGQVPGRGAEGSGPQTASPRARSAGLGTPPAACCAHAPPGVLATPRSPNGCPCPLSPSVPAAPTSEEAQEEGKWGPGRRPRPPCVLSDPHP